MVEFRSDMTVILRSDEAFDFFVAQSARVSTGTTSPVDDEADAKLIDFLMRNRHGSPFEHNILTFYIEAPIFVAREFMRHRHASFNEQSGRYSELKPVFYVPGPNRKLIQVGKTGEYRFEKGTQEQHQLVKAAFDANAENAYNEYEGLLQFGIAKEVARMVLPLNIYTSFYVTMNARGLMNFLSLRTTSEDSTFPSYPQVEIEMCAQKMETAWAELMPMTHAAFVKNGRVAP